MSQKSSIFHHIHRCLDFPFVCVLDENLYKLIYAEKIIHLLEFSTYNDIT